jgi:hypothetical protein
LTNSVHADEDEEEAPMKKKHTKKKKKKKAAPEKITEAKKMDDQSNQDLSTAILGGSRSRNSMQVCVSLKFVRGVWS